MNEIIFVEPVPYRGPTNQLEHIKEYFINKNVYDLGAGSGDAIAYILKTYKPKSIKGISIKGNRFQEQKKRYNLNIIEGDINDLNFSNENIDTYYIWIEDPDTEINVINQLRKNSKKCHVIIGYNIKAFCKGKPNNNDDFNMECKMCSYLSKVVDKVNIVKTFLRNKNINYIEKDIQYDEGKNCRQKGIVKYFIINL